MRRSRRLSLRFHELADGIEDGPELGVVFPLQFLPLAGEVAVASQQVSKAH